MNSSCEFLEELHSCGSPPTDGPFQTAIASRSTNHAMLRWRWLWGRRKTKYPAIFSFQTFSSVHHPVRRVPTKNSPVDDIPGKKLSKFLHCKGFSVVGGAPRRTTGPSPNRCLYLQKPRRPPHLSCLYIRTVFTFLCLLQGGRQLLLFVPVLLPGGGRTSCCCLWFSISHRR